MFRASLERLTTLCLGSDDGATYETERYAPALAQYLSYQMQQPRCSVRDIVNLNATVRGLTASRLRTGPIWVGSTHPANSTFVAPTANALPQAMSDLVQMLHMPRYPDLLKAFIALGQLLLLHPFEDGNGRTARALFAIVALRSPIPPRFIAKFLERLWEFQAMRLHTALQSVRIERDWRPALAFGLQLFHELAANFSCSPRLSG